MVELNKTVPFSTVVIHCIGVALFLVSLHGVAVSIHHYFVSVFGLSDGTRAF